MFGVDCGKNGVLLEDSALSASGNLASVKLEEIDIVPIAAAILKYQHGLPEEWGRLSNFKKILVKLTSLAKGKRVMVPTRIRMPAQQQPEPMRLTVFAPTDHLKIQNAFGSNEKVWPLEPRSESDSELEFWGKFLSRHVMYDHLAGNMPFLPKVTVENVRADRNIREQPKRSEAATALRKAFLLDAGAKEDEYRRRTDELRATDELNEIPTTRRDLDPKSWPNAPKDAGYQPESNYFYKNRNFDMDAIVVSKLDRPCVALLDGSDYKLNIEPVQNSRSSDYYDDRCAFCCYNTEDAREKKYVGSAVGRNEVSVMTQSLCQQHYFAILLCHECRHSMLGDGKCSTSYRASCILALVYNGMPQ